MIKQLRRQDYEIQEFIMQLLISLQYNQLAKKFVRPVDITEAPGYHQRIKNPMDLQKIINRFKEGFYSNALQIKQDLSLILRNCQQYNIDPSLPIRKKAQKFGKQIQNQWEKFIASCKQKQIDHLGQLHMSQAKRMNMTIIQQKKTKKRLNIDPGQIITKRVKQKEDFIQQILERPQSLQIIVNMDQIRQTFQACAQKKILKYQKLVSFYFKKISQFMNDFMNKYEKMQIPRHLMAQMEQTDLIKAINIRKIQLFLKQFAYWIKKFNYLFPNHNKLQLFNYCKLLRKCIHQIIQYRDSKDVIIQIQIPFQLPHDGMPISEVLSDQPQIINYQSKMKQFRRMLQRDQKCVPKRQISLSIARVDDQVIKINDKLFQKKKKLSIQSLAPNKFGIKIPDAYQERSSEDRAWCQKFGSLSLTNFFKTFDFRQIKTGLQIVNIKPFRLNY